MLTYYIDEPLYALEQKMVIEQINTICSNKVDRLDFIKLIEAFPENDSDLTHAEIIKAFEDLLIKLEIPTGV